MAMGCLNLLFWGAFSWVFEKSNKEKNKQLDRVEIEPHTWMGMSGKTRYNRRYLGPIQTKTFLSSSKSMVKAVDVYEKLLIKMTSDQIDCNDYPKNNDIQQVLELHEKICRYIRQIDSRNSLRCYVEWKNENPDSFSGYEKARSKAINLDSKLEEAGRRSGFNVQR